MVEAMAELKTLQSSSSSSSAAAAAAAAAANWLEKRAAKSEALTKSRIWNGGLFDAVSLSTLRISLCSSGRISCSFRIPPRLTDGDGNWEAGAIATLIDDVGAAAIMTVVGHAKISVDFSISYFLPARIDEEVDIDARIVEHRENGKMTMVSVEIRKKGSGKLVALGRQWMASSRPKQRSKI